MIFNIIRNIAMFLDIKSRKFLSNESGEVNIVAIVVLIGIAVLLAIVFKDAIAQLLENIFHNINDNATGAVSDTIEPIDIGN